MVGLSNNVERSKKNMLCDASLNSELISDSWLPPNVTYWSSIIVVDSAVQALAASLIIPLISLTIFKSD